MIHSWIETWTSPIIVIKNTRDPCLEKTLTPSIMWIKSTRSTRSRGSKYFAPVLSFGPKIVSIFSFLLCECGFYLPSFRFLKTVLTLIFSFQNHIDFFSVHSQGILSKYGTIYELHLKSFFKRPVRFLCG